MLVFQLKPSSQPFETRAPVKAVAISATGALGPLQTLTSSRAKEPVVMPLAGGRALTMWSGERGLGASLAGADGTFKKTADAQGPAAAAVSLQLDQPRPAHRRPLRDLHLVARVRRPRAREHSQVLTAPVSRSERIPLTFRLGSWRRGWRATGLAPIPTALVGLPAAMFFTTKAEYGVRLLIELGRQPGHRRCR